MASHSTHDPDNLSQPLERPAAGTRRAPHSRGPSDSSDSGSDMARRRLIDADALPLDRGTNEDPEAGSLDGDAGASVGDPGLDAATDQHRTGEHLTAGREPAERVGEDTDVDRVVGADEAGLDSGTDQVDEAVELGIGDQDPDEEDR